MKYKILRCLTAIAICLALVLNFTYPALAEDILIDAGELDGPLYSEYITFPYFGDEVDYSRGMPTAEEEAYPDYKAYIADRHGFSDMVGHSSEVSAVRLAEMGIFEKTESFSPDGSMTVMEFMRALLKLCGGNNTAAGSDSMVKEFVKKTALLDSGVEIDYSETLTNELLAYLLGRAAKDTANSAQYRLLLDDYESIDKSLQSSVLDSVAAGIIEIKSFKLNPKSSAKRSDIADGLYRLYNPAARIVPLFDLGDNYSEEKDTYTVKSSYIKNESGVQLGFYTNYDKQQDAFLNYGTLPIDRTGFYKWAKIETSEGVYEMPGFSNDKSSHKAGNTVINCIDISATPNWNNLLTDSNIPEFYSQSITDTETREAAKKFLYEFVTQMLSSVGGDVLLAIDYEVDNFLGLWNNESGKTKAQEFAKWYAEACEVARQAAADLNMSENLKLMVIYNNITNLHLLGVSENQWMLDIAECADYIGIDTYQFYDDKTDPSYTIQNIRYLMNNYSLGKPVIVVENGLGILRDLETVDEVTGLTQMELAEQYYKNLFREFAFSLERGDFLNANLEGFLIWSYYDTSETSEKINGVVNGDNTLRDNGIAIKNGIASLYRQRQFDPSRLSAVSAFESGITLNAKSGTEYDELTIVAKGSGDDGTAAVAVELDSEATVMVTVNGEEYYTDYLYRKIHSVEINNLRKGTNVIKIRVGQEKTPFEIKVLKAELVTNEVSSWSDIDEAPDGNLISGKGVYAITSGKGIGNSTKTATGGSELTLWTNGDLTDDVSGLYMSSSKGRLISYDLGAAYGVSNLMLSSGSETLPTQTRWKAYLAGTHAELFKEENCIAYVTNEAQNAAVDQYVSVNKLKTGRYFGIKLLDNGTDQNAYISEVGVYMLSGDANLDGSFDARDLVHLKKFIAGKTEKVNSFNAVDYDSDGKLTASDLTEMRNTILGR